MPLYAMRLDRQPFLESRKEKHQPLAIHLASDKVGECQYLRSVASHAPTRVRIVFPSVKLYKTLV